jgi:lipopolysaccharide transport system permease protein
VKNILFPLEIIPLTINGAAVIQSFIGMSVLILLELFTKGFVHWTICFLPLLYIPLIFFVSGISWILAALGVFNRDINNLIQSIIQLFFLLSAVLFPLERLVRLVPDQMEWILRLNLLATIVDESRRVVIQGHPPEWLWLAYTFLAAFFLMIIGYACFMHFRRGFADVV